MKKLLKIFIVLCITYLLLNTVVSYFSHGYQITYSLYRKGIDVDITETYQRRIKNELDHYDFLIKLGNDEFQYRSLQTFASKRVIKDIKYIKDGDFLCVLPIFNNDRVETDVLCKHKSGSYYNYSSMTNPSKKIKEFVNSISEYEQRNYQDKTGNIETKDLMKVYTNNLSDDFAFGITNYKGLYLLNHQKIENITLFKQDFYTRELSAFTDRYYITANYEENYDYKTFYLIDLKTGEQSEMTSKNAISADSYIAGVVDNLIYLIDKSNEKEYEINVEKKTIKEIGNQKNDMLYYQHGKWEKVPYTRMTLKNTYFDLLSPTTSENYTLFLKNNSYSYYYKKVDDQYEIYRVDTGKSIKEAKLYLFTTKDISKMKAIGAYLFWQEEDKIKYYHDKSGIKTLLQESELNFNQNILYSAYSK